MGTIQPYLSLEVTYELDEASTSPLRHENIRSAAKLGEEIPAKAQQLTPSRGKSKISPGLVWIQKTFYSAGPLLFISLSKGTSFLDRCRQLLWHDRVRIVPNRRRFCGPASRHRPRNSDRPRATRKTRDTTLGVGTGRPRRRDSLTGPASCPAATTRGSAYQSLWSTLPISQNPVDLSQVVLDGHPGTRGRPPEY